MYGVIGAEESSTTTAKLFVADGAPDQSSGGLTLAPWQVYRGGSGTFGANASLPIDNVRGGTGAPLPAVPQPAKVSAAIRAVPAAAERDRRRLPRRPRSWPEVTLASLPPWSILEPERKRKARGRVEWSGSARLQAGSPGRSVSLAGAAEHDLVPGRHRGAPAASRFPARPSRLLSGGLGRSPLDPLDPLTDRGRGWRLGGLGDRCVVVARRFLVRDPRCLRGRPRHGRRPVAALRS